MAMDVTLRQLRAYVAVLEAASFSEAARTMHLSQAALSGLIKELENRVGVRLLAARREKFLRLRSARPLHRWRGACSQTWTRRSTT
jgi:DNA-binding transcriptional LysR family regulator